VQSVCIHVYLELGEPLCDAAGYLEILCAPCCYAVLKCEKGTDVMLKGLGMPTKQSPSCTPEYLHADSN